MLELSFLYQTRLKTTISKRNGGYCAKYSFQNSFQNSFHILLKYGCITYISWWLPELKYWQWKTPKRWFPTISSQCNQWLLLLQLLWNVYSSDMVSCLPLTPKLTQLVVEQVRWCSKPVTNLRTWACGSWGTTCQRPCRNNQVGSYAVSAFLPSWFHPRCGNCGRRWQTACVILQQLQSCCQQ